MHGLGRTNGIPIFDPVTIDELSMVFALQKAEARKSAKQLFSFQERHRWPIETEDSYAVDVAWPIRLPAHEIRQVDSDIKNQIRSRDFTLVDTATHLAVYRPFMNGKKSLGVDAEIKRANDNFSNVIVYHPEEDRTDGGATTHPFGSNITMFDDRAEFMSRIQKLVRRKDRDK